MKCTTPGCDLQSGRLPASDGLAADIAAVRAATSRHMRHRSIDDALAAEQLHLRQREAEVADLAARNVELASLLGAARRGDRQAWRRIVATLDAMNASKVRLADALRGLNDVHETLLAAPESA